MSRQVFAFKRGLNPRTLERWEQAEASPTSWLPRSFGLCGSTPTRWTGSSRSARRRKRAVGKHGRFAVVAVHRLPMGACVLQARWVPATDPIVALRC